MRQHLFKMLLLKHAHSHPPLFSLSFPFPPPGGHTAFPLAKDPNNNFNKSLSLESYPTEGCDPELSFHVGVKKGAAVLFYDCLEEEHMRGLVDPLSEHAGCDTSVCIYICIYICNNYVFGVFIFPYWG